MSMKMIYNFHEHGLYYEGQKQNVEFYSVTIGFLEVMCNVKDNNIIGVNGFLPVHEFEDCDLNFENAKKDKMRFNTDTQIGIEKWGVYDITLFDSRVEKCFKNRKARYDCKKKMIFWGQKFSRKDILMRINTNLVCSVDNKGVLSALYIFPDEIEGGPEDV